MSRPKWLAAFILALLLLRGGMAVVRAATAPATQPVNVPASSVKADDDDEKKGSKKAEDDDDDDEHEDEHEDDD